MSGVTSSLRFGGNHELNNDLHKFGLNLIPFPKLHFLSISHAPLFASNDTESPPKYDNDFIMYQIESKRSLFTNIQFEDGKLLCSSMLLQGNITYWELYDIYVYSQRTRFEWPESVEWIPNNNKMSIINVKPEYVPMRGTFTCNNTGIKNVFGDVSNKFNKLFQGKTMVHLYKNEGMDEMEMIEADQSLKDLVIEYQDKQDAIWEDEDEDDDYDDDYDEDEDEDDE